uniref:NPH3 domain-containing protein n=1 Tax=Macrostomum lignano TaxID=282301 RepID=A0A1I8J7E3_9PLAT
MTEILSGIISKPGAFGESAFQGIEAQGLTRDWIMKFIGLEQQGCDSNQRMEVVISIFYHLVDELYARGCSKSEICILAKLTAEYWIASLDRSMQENLRHLQSMVTPLAPRQISERAASIYLEYTVNSFLRHFALYRACLQQPQHQKQKQPSMQYSGRRLRRGILVESPEQPCPLRDGLRPEEHRYRCQLRELDTEEQLARAAGAERRLGESAEIAQRRRNLEATMTRSRLIGEILQMNLRQMRLRTQDLTDSACIDLVYKAKRTALPRPASMGPPPRYSASTVGASGPAGGDRKSSRGSSRSSAKSKTAGDGKKSKAAK